MTKKIYNDMLDSYEDKQSDRRIIFALCVILFVPSLNNFVNCILQIGLNVYWDFLTPVSYIFMAFCSVFFLYRYASRRGSLLIFSAVILVGSIISYFMYPEIRSALYDSPVDLVYSPLNKLFYFCIPAMIGVTNLKNYDRLLESLKAWSRATVAVGVFTYLFVWMLKGGTLQYMVYSYNMLISVCACFIRGEHRRKTDLVLAILGSFCIVACGARGAVISLLIFLAIRGLSALIKNRSKKNVIIAVVCLLVLAFFVLFYKSIILNIAAIFARNNVDSRFINSLVDGTLVESHGRETIVNSVIKAIKANPLGYGLFGDRYAAAEYGAGMAIYTHNILIEAICQFGVLFGPMLLAFFAWRLLKTLINCNGTSVSIIILILLPYGLFQLFVTSSYLECVPFFALLGILVFTKFERQGS